MTEGSLRDEIEKLNKNFDEMVSKKETKKFRVPFAAKVNKKKVRDGWVSICVVNENRSIRFIKAQIKEGTVMIDGAPFLSTTDYMLNYKNRPFLIVPAWSIEPFAPQKNLDEVTEKQKMNVGFRLLLNRLKSEQIKPKANISMGMIIILLLVIGGVIYYFSRSGAA